MNPPKIKFYNVINTQKEGITMEQILASYTMNKLGENICVVYGNFTVSEKNWQIPIEPPFQLSNVVLGTTACTPYGDIDKFLH